MVKLTEKTIRAIEPPGRGYKLIADSELPGFGLRVTAAGVRTFVLTYQAAGRQRRVSIGRWDAWSAAAARERARALRRDIDAGIDPLAERTRLRTEPDFAGLVAHYFEIEGVRQKGAAEYRRMLERDALPVLGSMKARDVQRRDVRELVERKAQTAPVMANRLFETIRRVFAFAVSREIVETSPCYMVKRPAPERSKDRVLSRQELRAFWAALDGPAFTRQTAAALRLILATAQRPGEVCGIEWAELDLANSLWTIPAERSKNGLAHRVPLNETARGVPYALNRTSGYVFPSPRPGVPIHRNALALALRRARSRESGRLEVGAFAPHDLRRTAASIMASAGVERFIVGHVLNHVEPGVTKVYDRHGYDAEKRRALDILDRRLRAILAGEPLEEKVVAIR